MKILPIFLVCGVALVGSAQTSLRTFTSPDGVFRFEYSDILVNCMPARSAAMPTTSGNSVDDQTAAPPVPKSCMSQGDFCSGPGSGGSPLACFAYPNERFEDKPQFGTATFYVSEIQSAGTEDVCLKGSSDWFVINSKAATTTINHIAFKTFEIGDNWTSGGQSGPAYRTFHDGKCYELGIQTVTSRAVYDPGTVKEFTKKDWSEVDGRLRKALNSFSFLK